VAWFRPCREMRKTTVAQEFLRYFATRRNELFILNDE